MNKEQLEDIKELSIIIVTYNNENTIENCLDSIWCHIGSDLEVIVVDNSENSMTAGKIKQFIRDHQKREIKMIEPEQNIGFARGCNLGAKNATGKYLMFLNPDTIIKNDIYSYLKKCLETYPETGIAGPKMIDADGRIIKTCRNLPTGLNIFLDVIGIDRVLGTYQLVRFPHRRIRYVEQVIGACFFMKKDLFKQLNGFDERFFIYFEEVDFCKRTSDLGLKTIFCPQAEIVHISGTSCESEKTVARMIAQLRFSRKLYFQKHFVKGQVFIINILNRLEGILKGAFFVCLYGITGKRYFNEKAIGFLSIGLWPGKFLQ